MNIIKIQDQLKGVPDNTLVGYVQNPSGQVPTYLALSELQRRKEMRSKFQSNQPQDKTVAEDLVQEAQPGLMGLSAGEPMQQAMEPPPEMPMEQMAQGGLAELDTGNMYAENNYANGGIVAFDDGGEVATSRFGRWWEGSKAKGQANLAIQDEIQRLQNEYLNLSPGFFTKTTSSQDVANKARQAEIKQRLAELTNKSAPVAPSPTATTGGPRMDTTELPKSFTGMGETTQFGPSITAMNQMTTPPAPAATKPAGPDFGGLYQPLTDYSKEYAALYQDPTGMAEKEMARYKSLIGEDTMRPKLEEKLAKMEERANKMEEQAPWMALAKAGFEMASSRPEYGKGQSAIADIARGAGVGVKEYGAAREKLEASREKQFDLQAKLAQAKRAEDVAAATFGTNSEQFIKAQNQANKLAELSYKTSREAANQKNKIDAFEAVQKGKLYGAQAEYYGEKGPSGEITEKALFDKYISSGGEFVNGPWETFKLKYGAKPIPADVNNIVSKYLK
jgi:hypothetical protein